MRLLLLPTILLIILNVGVDACIFRVLRKSCSSRVPAVIHFVVALLLLGLVVSAVALPRRSIDDSGLLTIMWMLYAYLTFYLPKYVWLIFDLLAHLPRLFHRKTLKCVRYAGVVAGVLLFITMWWGALVTRSSTELREVDLEFSRLPEAFDGYRIVQISDLHVGSWGTDTAFVAKVVDEVNALEPDVVFFTGDIVNRHSTELLPFIPVLSRLHAADGVISILGNHDYGDYIDWKSPEEKAGNMHLLYDFDDRLGWDLLRNEHRCIKHGADSIMVVGVENWGDPPFPTYGKLDVAYPALTDDNFKILLTHNPAHWRAQVLSETNIDLSLSGHTHAMQIEADIFGLRLSPAVWRYKEWGGVYREDGQVLYVNIGLGEVALPMRVGATPEITLITLHRK